MGYGKYNPFIAFVAGILLFTGSLHAEDRLSTAALKRAYSTGAKSILAISDIRIERFGHSARFTLRNTGQGDLSLRCLLCTPSEMLSTARDLGATWARQTGNQGSTTLSLTDTENTQVWLNDVPVAPVDTPHPISVGTVSITAKSGTTVIRGTLKVDANQSAIALSVDTLEAERVDHRIPAAIILTGLAASAAATAGIFLAMDGECTESTCHYQYQLKTPGIISVAAAAVLQVTAGALLGTVLFGSKQE